MQMNSINEDEFIKSEKKFRDDWLYFYWKYINRQVVNVRKRIFRASRSKEYSTL